MLETKFKLGLLHSGDNFKSKKKKIQGSDLGVVGLCVGSIFYLRLLRCVCVHSLPIQNVG